MAHHDTSHLHLAVEAEGGIHEPENLSRASGPDCDNLMAAAECESGWTRWTGTDSSELRGLDRPGPGRDFVEELGGGVHGPGVGHGEVEHLSKLDDRADYGFELHRPS